MLIFPTPLKSSFLSAVVSSARAAVSQWGVRCVDISAIQETLSSSATQLVKQDHVHLI